MLKISATPFAISDALNCGTSTRHRRLVCDASRHPSDARSLVSRSVGVFSSDVRGYTTKGTPVTEKTEKKTARTPRDCECSCGEQTKGGRFRPGHDGRLKGHLIRDYREATTAAQRKRVAAKFEALGWSHFIPKV